MIDSNLAGIIPISGQSRVDYNFPWHDSLMPIGNEYYAIQRAVYECAIVGCKTIWIVSDLAFQPLIKEVVQEWIMDPFTIDKDKIKEAYDHVRIPIYYVPIHGKDRQRRDCLSWSALYGCLMSSEVSTKMSSWMNYERFYITFPHLVFDTATELGGYRKPVDNKISTSDSQFCLSFEGNSIASGHKMSFTISQDQLAKSIKEFKKLEYQEARGGNRHPAVNFSLDKVFGSVYDGIEVEKHVLSSCYQIDTWQGYKKMLSETNLVKPRVIEKFERRNKRWKRMFHEN